MTEPGRVVGSNGLRSSSSSYSIGYDADLEGDLSDDADSISIGGSSTGDVSVVRDASLRADRQSEIRSFERHNIPEDRIFWNAMERLAASGDPAARENRKNYIERWVPIANAYVAAMRNPAAKTGEDFEPVWQSYARLHKLFEEIVKDPMFPRVSVSVSTSDADSDSSSVISEARPRPTRLLDQNSGELFDSPDDDMPDFGLSGDRSEIVDHSRVLPRSLEDAKRAHGRAQNTLLRLLKEHVEGPVLQENIEAMVKHARDQVYWTKENLEFWNHHTAYSSDRTSQSDFDGKSESEVVVHPEVKKLSDLLEEKEWYRLYIHPQDHAVARELFPDDPGKYYDQTDPGYQKSMLDAYHQVLDSKDLASIELNYQTYNHWHDLVNSHLENMVEVTGSVQQRNANAVTSHPIRSPHVSATLLTEKVGDKKLVGDLGDNSVTWLYDGSIMSNFSAEEIPGMLDSVFDRYKKEIEQAADASDKFHAIGRAVRTVQTIHPNSDTNSRLNIYLMTPALLQQNGFKPVVIRDLHTMFQGGRSLDQIASALQEGQKVDLLTNDPPTLIAEPRSDVQVFSPNVELPGNDAGQSDLEINFNYESSASSHTTSRASLINQSAGWQSGVENVSLDGSPQFTSNTVPSTSSIAVAASIRSTSQTGGPVQEVAGQATPLTTPSPTRQAQTSTSSSKLS